MPRPLTLTEACCPALPNARCRSIVRRACGPSIAVIIAEALAGAPPLRPHQQRNSSQPGDAPRGNPGPDGLAGFVPPAESTALAPQLRSRLSALPPPLRSAALPTRLSALPSLPCMSVRLFSGRMRGRHMRPRARSARARRRCRRGTHNLWLKPLAAPVRRPRWVRAAPTIGATRGASAVAMAVETCLLACLLPS